MTRLSIGDHLDSFGEWLRRRRESLGLTRAELAECVGCSVSALRKIEADERRPSRQLAELLAGRLRIAPEEQLLFLDAARGVRRVERLGSPVPARAEVLAGAWADAGPTWNLPAPATPLIGREAELATLAQLLSDPGCRLLTLVGPGGIGKTRLALEVACFQWERFSDGVFFASLASVTSAEHLVPAIAQAVGFNFSGPADSRTQLMRFLSRKQALLLLDNLEHLLEAVDVLVELLARAPGVKLLVTSRERLALSGEWVFELQGLPVPAQNKVEELEKYSAVQLFLQRARRAHVDFELSVEEYPEVVRICRLTEGMPLAIELAAAWVPVLPCAGIADEIERGLDILTTTLRDAPERQRSMRAVFEHSRELLTEEEQEALYQLSLFRGGFQRDAAQAVAGANLSVLSALFSKSLLRRNKSGRYDLHELIRQCAMEHLRLDSQLWAETKDRYIAFHITLAETAEAQLKGANQLHWLERLEQEHDNLRVVLKWLLAADGPAADNDITLALQVASALRWFWYMRGHFHEGLDWLIKILQRCPGQRTAARARALQAAGLLANILGQHDAAVSLAEESITIYRELGDRRGLADALTLKGVALRWHDDVTLGNACLQEALALHREVGDRWGTARDLFELGKFFADFRGEIIGRAMLEESAAILEELGDRYVFSNTLIQLGIVVIGQADYVSASKYLERSLAISRSSCFPWATADASTNLGYLLRLQGDYGTARGYFEESVRLYQKGSGRMWEIDPLCALAETDLLQGELAAARARLAEVSARPELSLNKWLQVLVGYLQGILAYYEGDKGRAVTLLEETIMLAREGDYKPDLARSLVALGRARCRRGEETEAAVLLQEGLRLFLELGHRLGIVTALEALAELAAEDATQAVRLLATADATRKTIGAPLPPVDQASRESLLAAMGDRLTEETFARAWAEGQASSPEQAAASILAVAPGKATRCSDTRT